jgi:hypothetical protein
MLLVRVNKHRLPSQMNLLPTLGVLGQWGEDSGSRFVLMAEFHGRHHVSTPAVIHKLPGAARTLYIDAQVLIGTVQVLNILQLLMRGSSYYNIFGVHLKIFRIPLSVRYHFNTGEP